MEPYKARNIDFTGIQSIKHWQIKTYSIIYDRASFSKELVNESIGLLKNELPGITDHTYGLGFLITHHGKGSNFVLIDWWHNENELQHQVYYSSKESPEKLIKQNSSAPAACVWDLIVINHERNAWVKHMMINEPKTNNYLNDYIHGKY